MPYKKLLMLIVLILLPFIYTYSQCSLCTRTAQQLGTKPAQGLNTGILYLMAAPFAIVGFISYQWWKRKKNIES